MNARWDRMYAMAAMVAAPLLMAAVAAGQDSERILEFHTDITVHRDSTLTVIETIKVRATGDKIKRGIYRDFPVRYSGRDFSRARVPFEVVSVERDGRPEPYHTETKPPYERVYIGSVDVMLKPGEYTYRLTYRTGRQLGYFTDHDELYWNVTGNEWDFPIDKVSAAVTLPAGIPADRIHHEGYSGPRGAKGQDYTSSVEAQGQARFATTRPLAPGEGLTIVVTFPKGFVAEPTAEEKIAFFFQDNVVILVGLVGAVVAAVYFLLAWARVGRDPEKGVIIPLFGPPEDMSPADVRYVLRMGFDRACLAATVIGLAVKRRLTIKEDNGKYTLIRDKDHPGGKLSSREEDVLQQLLSSRQLELDNKNHSKISGAVKKLKDSLAAAYSGKLFFPNRKHFIVGAAMSVATMAAMALTGAIVLRDPSVPFLAIWLSGWSVGVFFLVAMCLSAWRAVLAGGGGAFERAGTVGAAVFITLFATPFVVGEVVVGFLLLKATSLWLLPVLAALLLLNVGFFHLLKRPTVDGRKVMDQIEGFRMYLATAEADTLNAAYPPQRTPELFEKFLPYALALGVENAWAGKFADVLGKADQGGYEPQWYRGTAWATFGATAFATSFGSSFSGAMASAGTAPGSSSGSGGGGSSGGGGGGGGGGGW